MSKNPYRKNPAGNVLSDLQSRANVYKNGPHFNAATRNPAWIQITGHGPKAGIKTKSKTIPVNQNTFGEVYSSGFKISPILSDASITFGGDFGLTMTLEATIQCHLMRDFEEVEKAFLYPGSVIDVAFGYGNPRPAGYSSGHKFKGFRTATYSFNTTEQGFWIAKFKAVAPSEAAKTLDMSTSLSADGLKYLDGGKTYNVHGMAELMASDAQINGQKSIDEMADGETITSFAQHIYSESPGAIVVFTSDHLKSGGVIQNTLSSFMSWTSGDTSSEVKESKNIPYYTLEYIVNRIIMGQLKANLNNSIHSDDKPDFKKVAIKFHPTYSKSSIPRHVRSGAPTKVLLLGADRGDYLNGAGVGKDFEKAPAIKLGTVNCQMSTADGRSIIDFKKILIERTAILSALGDLDKARAPGTTTDVKQFQEGVINVETFLNGIFNQIKAATGGSIALRLTQNPDDTDDAKFEQIIVDENYGVADKLKCIVFNPIDGDGSTRVCSLTSGVGSQEYKAGMFAGAMRKGDAVNQAKGALDPIKSARSAQYSKEIIKATQIIKNPGSLGASHFDSVQQDSLMACMGSLRQNAAGSDEFELCMYPGIGIDITLDGIFGFYPGNAISSKQLTKGYFKYNYFYVQSVTHTFNQSDWETKITGILSFFKNIEYKYL